MAKKGKRYPQRRFARREDVRASYEAVLIVCEGKKTEPRYFEGLRKSYLLSSANVTVVPSDRADGNDPRSIVRYAIEKLDQPSGDWDHVYCVFDRDGHATFDEACQLARQSAFGIAGRLHVVPSWPCFELWVLLHYEYTTAAFNAAGGKSSCARVLDRVKNHIDDYEKDFEGIFKELFPRTDTALNHGARLQAYNRATGSINPATAVHRLVAKLRALRHGIPT